MISFRDSTDTPSSKIPLILCGLSGLALLILGLVYSIRPLSAAALLFFPLWLWALPALLVLLPGLFFRPRRWTLGLLAVWVLFLAFYMNETSSVLRGLTTRWPASQWANLVETGKGIRVFSFNCANRDKATLLQYEHLQPDIVFLQEALLPRDLDELKPRLVGTQGSLLRQGDSVILVRGTIQAFDGIPPEQHFFAPARVQLQSGYQCVVLGLHLKAPVARYDLWSPSCWAEHAVDREKQSQQLLQVMAWITATVPGQPLIMGGDFNAPAGDGLYTILQPAFRDTFRHAGLGWGNTILNQYPIARFDQIWVSGDFKPLATVARKAVDSDHRLVISDLVLR
ncbi:MAG: endonuclease/exonuclease/phosphatase family protein [bacterium]|jgi:endonuclease/exonuclease/phosphatase (EEP) superfamily protein YafD|nr:endonuclease/exonuclease/phosphatase family protein [bacterium]